MTKDDPVQKKKKISEVRNQNSLSKPTVECYFFPYKSDTYSSSKN